MEYKDYSWPYSFVQPFTITSPATDTYNCIAHAAENSTVWFEPDQTGISLGVCFWPRKAPLEKTITAYIAVYELLGYKRCSDGTPENGFIKVAVFALNGKPTHAARQLPDGLWTSKLGKNIDVSHTILAIENGVYGNVVQYLKKKN